MPPKHFSKKDKKKGKKRVTKIDLLKYEIAEELGLMDRVKTHGWHSLSAAETGRIGGIMTRKLKSGEVKIRNTWSKHKKKKKKSAI